MGVANVDLYYGKQFSVISPKRPSWEGTCLLPLVGTDKQVAGCGPGV